MRNPFDTFGSSSFSFAEWVDETAGGSESIPGGGSCRGGGRPAMRVAVRVRPFCPHELDDIEEEGRGGGVDDEPTSAGGHCIVSMNGDRLVLVNPEAFHAEPSAIAAAAAAAGEAGLDSSGWARTFTFDDCLWSHGVNDPHYASQEGVFRTLGSEMVDDALVHGRHISCFAYGATTSGKTYSMLGANESDGSICLDHDLRRSDGEGCGLIPRFCRDLLGHIAEQRQSSATALVDDVDSGDGDGDSAAIDVLAIGSDRTRENFVASVSASFVEIYGTSRSERIRDLLNPSSSARADDRMRVREHPERGPYVENLAAVDIENYAQLEQLIVAGNGARATESVSEPVASSHSVRSSAAPRRNNHLASGSSRSHALLTLELRRRDGTTTKVQLVDLAGSEKLPTGDTEPTDLGSIGSQRGRAAAEQHAQEAAYISKTLGSLGVIIKALSSSSAANNGRARAGLPFRDNYLTWLLKEGLGGNACATMLACISPWGKHYNETLSTLKYAERARRIVAQAGAVGSVTSPFTPAVASSSSSFITATPSNGGGSRSPPRRGMTTLDDANSFIDTPDPRPHTNRTASSGDRSNKTTGTPAGRSAATSDKVARGRLNPFLAEEFDGLHSHLGGGTTHRGSDAAKLLLKMTVGDPQQRLAKLARSPALLGPGADTKRRTIATQTGAELYPVLGKEEDLKKVWEMQATVAELEMELSAVKVDRDMAVAESRAARESAKKAAKETRGCISVEEADDLRRRLSLMRIENVELQKHAFSMTQRAVGERAAAAGEEAKATAARGDRDAAAAEVAELRRRLAESESRAETAAEAGAVNEQRTQVQISEAVAEAVTASRKAWERGLEGSELHSIRQELKEVTSERKALVKALHAAEAEAQAHAVAGPQQRFELQVKLNEVSSERDRLMAECGTLRTQSLAHRDATERMEHMLRDRQITLDRISSNEERHSRKEQDLTNALHVETEELQRELVDVQVLTELLSHYRESAAGLEASRQQLAVEYASLDTERSRHRKTAAQLLELQRRVGAGANGDVDLEVSLETERQSSTALRKELDALALARASDKLEFDRKMQAAEASSASASERALQGVLKDVQVQGVAVKARIAELEESRRAAQAEATALQETVAKKDEELNASRVEVENVQTSSSRELAALWLAINKLDVLDAAKDKALMELQADRDSALNREHSARQSVAEFQHILADVDKQLLEATGVGARGLLDADQSLISVSTEPPPHHHHHPSSSQQQHQGSFSIVGGTPGTAATLGGIKAVRGALIAGGGGGGQAQAPAWQESVEQQIEELSALINNNV